MEQHFVIAKTADQMMVAQQSLIEHMTQKVEAEQQALADKTENLEHAKRTKIRTAGWAKEVAIAKQRVRYYQSALDALNEGYAIIPDFPISIIAVRTSKLSPKEQELVRYRKIDDVPSEQLPTGLGDYVAPEPELRHFDKAVPDGKGGFDRKMMVATTGKFRAIDFPLKAVKPQILAELDKALKGKIFDEIGIIPAFGSNKRHSDPMLIGRIHCKDKQARSLSFLITWWIDTTTL